MQNATSVQRTLLDELRALDPAMRMEWDETRGVAAFIRGKLVPPLRAHTEPQSTIREFLETYGELFGPRNLNRRLRLLRNRNDDIGWTHLEFQQEHIEEEGAGAGEPLEVYASKLAAHFLPDGLLTEVQSSCWRDVRLETEARLTAEDLRALLTRAAAQAPGFRKLQRQMQERHEDNFPVMQTPRLVIYPWQGGFRMAWTTYAYGVSEVEDLAAKPTGAREIGFGKVFVDASTGEQFLFAPTRMGAETADVGTGLGVTPLGGPYATRSLNMVRVDTSSTYRLRDTTHNRDIITYDANCNASWTHPLDLLLHSGTIPVSEDTDGDKAWNRLPVDTTDAERTASQQPEVEAHFFCREAYEWYDALAGGRDGWDDNQYDPSIVPHVPIRAVVHVKSGYYHTCRLVKAYYDKGLAGGKWLPYIFFFDGDPTATCVTPNDTAFDYPAGSKWWVGHEYQHGITDFSFEDPDGNPGLDYTSGTWSAAVHEGLADVFGCLFSESWTPGPEFSSAGLVFRNFVFPRDPGSWANGSPCGLENHNKDHFGDRNEHDGFEYDRGTILAHCAYLMAQGGVHQRASRTPVLIPVYSLGRQTLGGKDIPKAARIWYRALTHYFSTHGNLTGIPSSDESMFRTLRSGCVHAAEDLYGTGSLEHRNTILAFYAVGLHPAPGSYGADVTFLRWGASWRMSRPYVGLSSPDWSSLDLFVNNGGLSEWNARINVLDAMGNPTNFENNVYCRVRNVGDQNAQQVQVQFAYAKIGTGTTTWLPVADKDGNVQILNVGTLAAGQSNFPDSDQNSPPAGASVKWYIPPLAPGETVDHFCLKATVTSVNDVNPHNNQVQSNIAYAPYLWAAGFSMEFIAGNPTEKRIPLQLQVQAALPEAWRVHMAEPMADAWLSPEEERPYPIKIDMPPGADEQLAPPFDGTVEGRMAGNLSGHFAGTLTETSWDGGHLQGRFSADLEEVGGVVGRFEGRLNVLTGEIAGRLLGAFQSAVQNGSSRVSISLRAYLRPWRRVDISQIVDGEAIGGITIQVQVPLPAGASAQELPPTDVYHG